MSNYNHNRRTDEPSSESSTFIKMFLPPEMVMHKVLCVAGGLLLPAILIPVVHLTGFSEIVEEITKTLIVWLIVLQIPGFANEIFWASVFAFLFGLSESIFYFSSSIDAGNSVIFLDRMVSTVPMHIVTTLVILLFGKMGKKYLVLGLVIAVAIHLLFNHYVGMLAI